MSLSEYFEQHEEQAFVAKALATAIAIILVKSYLAGFLTFLFWIFPIVFLLMVRMHAATSGVDTMELLREHITFIPVIRAEGELRTEVKPWVTYGIILANILIFYCFELHVDPTVLGNLVFLPHEPNLFNVPLSAVTSIFLHGSGGHLWGNMIFLWVVGTAVERRVGAKTFSWLYMVTGLIGGLAFVTVEFLASGRAGHALGASGAIAGIMGIFAVRCYFKSMIFPVPILGIFSLILPVSLKIRLNSLVIMALFFLSDLSGGIEQIAGTSESMVAHWAHLGGMMSGMLIAAFLLKLGDEAMEERHLEIGLKAAQAEIGYGDGERSLRIALERSPENIDAVLGMARLQSKFSCSPEGREFYEKALRLMLTARPQEGLEVFREFYGKYQVVPDEPNMLWRLAEMLRKAQEAEMCLPCLERLVELEATTPTIREKAHFQLANLLEQTGRDDAARRCFARFVAAYPNSILADKARQKAGTEVYEEKPREIVVAVAQTFQLCSRCGKEMTRRPATGGAQKGREFWVCAGYPGCKSVVPVAAEATPETTAPQRYRLVFAGEVALWCDKEDICTALAQLFHCDRARIDRLFQGGTTVLKRNLDHAGALKMKSAFDRTGAICAIEADEVAVQPAPPAVALASVAVATPAAPGFSCPKCGHPQEKGESCVMCGVYFAKLANRIEKEMHGLSEPMPGMAARSGMSDEHARRWAMLCHLSVFSGALIPFGNILGPLAIWLWKRKQADFVDYHGKVALNYQLTLLIFFVGCGMVAAFSFAVVRMLSPVLGLLAVYTLVAIVLAAVKAQRGDYAEISLSAQFLK